jgi:ParB family chromosome partitioning protein
MNTTVIPLDQLKLSDSNVRKTIVGIDDLAASICAHGLLQNLSVVPNCEGFDVVAGGRRLRALQKLVADGKLPADFGVPCNLLDAGSALEASTAENVVRQAMHPADEFDAFAKLAQEGTPTHEIADRFGCEEKHVRQRLKLANVAPSLIAAYRAGDATLEQLMALAITDDHAAQERVWKAARQPWERQPRQLREALTDKEYRLGGHPIANYVGVDAYRNAGGEIRQDLFGDDGEGFMVDTKLADRLAMEKLERRAEQLRKDGWLWVEARLTFDKYGVDARAFTQVEPTRHGNKEVWPDEVKAGAGVIVAPPEYRNETKARVICGLVRPGDRKKLAGTKAKTATGKRVTAKKPGDLSFAATQRLQGFRTAVLRDHIARRPAIALPALVASLAATWRKTPSGVDTITGIQRATDYTHRADLAVTEGIDAAPQTAVLREHLATFKHIGQDHDCMFAALLEQPLEVVMVLLAGLIADAVLAAEKAPKDHDAGARFAQLCGIDFADHWQPTAEWIATVPASTAIAAVTEACGEIEGARLKKLRGPELHQAAAEALAGKRWLPPPLRAPAPPKPKAAKAPKSRKTKAPAEVAA